jgi:DNA-binding transcriptional LysR family regulator
MLRLGVERRVEVTTFSFVSALSLVVGTNRIATVHRRLADYGKQFLPIVVLPAPLELPSMVQSMQWHLHSTNDPGLIWLRSMMRQAVTRMDQHSQQR